MSLRQANIDRMRDGLFDVLVVGAGINGAVSAAALAGRGASVALIDRGDFGSFTSQESSNLVWGGFKYLENYELPLVFGLCRSRNRLMKSYPDNIKEIGFLAALDRAAPYRPWFAALGATAYWAIGMFGTRPPRLFSAESIKSEEPVIETRTVRGGIQYQDAYLIDNDSRFVFSFVRSSIDAGATVANYVELVSAVREGDRWIVQLRDVDSNQVLTTSARTIVNAAGPFVDTGTEQARSLLMWANMVNAAGGDEARHAISAMKYMVGTTGRKIGEEAVQIHGGMGVTWELDVAHYFKRLIAIGQIFGNADWHLDKLAAT